jgi:ABC-type lipoprotein export system ATPase subunit
LDHTEADRILYSKFKDNPDALTIIITHNENILRICDEIIVIANAWCRLGAVEKRLAFD